MTQAKAKLITFADYLAFDNGSDRRYELTYGDLIEVPPESDENVLISRALDRALSDLVGFRRVRTHQLAIEVMGQPKNRFPDLTVLQPEHLEQLQSLGQSAITLEMAPPLLVVEVVSPGVDNRRRDYLDKRNQYEWRGIAEYWIVDPQERRVTVLAMVEGTYRESVFVAKEVLISPTFPNWSLTVDEMLSP
ncbi:Uma2 family endonuclease [Nodosilinea sp. LEGE 06152]|uniref:Uma2 family endonuclease n=1 Tax=Nodosilinea sp. LEGE 06152 TaxID=2777966 RepID=UPI0018824B23|nr:Uma2 family endonuclease [Nodosilinea sp. LEGE 06152]MBE9157414.1 Uma2 family endonuclease [Nodosilinea sp. LEGE 06152]